MSGNDTAGIGRAPSAFRDLDGQVEEIRRARGTLRSRSMDSVVARARELRASPADVVGWCAAAAEMTRQLRGVELHDGQLFAGAALAAGLTVQMRTGEGKTFAAIAPAAVYAAGGRRVHVVTANPYLAERDEDWSGAVLRALGFTTGVTLPGASREATRRAYCADVVFGASSDFGFDFLRDGLALAGDGRVQAELDVAIVDEADAVLLDEARTPMVLSGPAPVAAEPILRAHAACQSLRIGADVDIDAAHRHFELTDEGVVRAEVALGVANLYESGPVDWPHLVGNALRARALLTRDRDYLVRDGRVLVVDEVTGRAVEGRRWSDGLHQAVEAKEGLPITAERRPLGRVSVGGYFSNYRTVVGMSGTLEGAEAELAAVYGMECVEVPPHRPVVRRDHPDALFADEDAKHAGVFDDVSRRHANGQPVLVGTGSVTATQAFSALLDSRGIPHRSLSAKNDAAEAAIIADAGRSGAVTVATQMAGRGVDIVLGGVDGQPEDRKRVIDAGGLMVWGLEHHPAERLDMQLRGRAGRQGDPGETRFAVSPDDDLAALAPSAPPHEATRRGQALAEQLDRELRDDVRGVEFVVDHLHLQLYGWRHRISSAIDLDHDLSEAVSLLAGKLAVDNRPWPQGLPPLEIPRRRRRRHSALVNHIVAALQRRIVELGEALWSQAARLVLQTLLVVLWPDELDRLDHYRSLTRIAPAFGNANPDWGRLAAGTYRSLCKATPEEWVRQLLAFTVRDDQREETPEQASLDISVPAAASQPPPSDPQLLGLWEGWSFNSLVRRHFGTKLPEPPLVLALDSIGDTPNEHGLRLRLDLDDPGRTVILRTDNGQPSS